MTDSAKRDALTLKRWSQRKLAAARAVAPPEPAASAPAPNAPPAPVSATPATPPREAAPAPLPPIESLSIESDFTAFLRPDVDESLKRGALRKLFSDPRFNVMDGLDVYIDDYSKSDTIAPEIVRTLAQWRYIFDPPATRVNEEGHVEDVPAQPVAEPAPAADPSLPAAGAGGDAARATPHDPLPLARESDREPES